MRGPPNAAGERKPKRRAELIKIKNKIKIKILSYGKNRDPEK